MASGDQVFDKNKLDSYMSLATSAADRFDKRREYEWKLTFAYWAVIVASFHRDFITNGVCDWAWWASAFFFVIVWLRWLSVANRNDKNRYEYFRDAADIMLFSDPKIHFCRNRVKKINVNTYEGLRIFMFDWSVIWQAVATFGLVYIRTTAN